ncbi:MAG: proton-conducting membrane transporter, partial [Defluviitaleaceae bacterium]|nr:proton-conducting membrane transporter [Defluviitaleaceae bacterium]
MLTYFVIAPVLIAVLLYLFHLNKSARIVAVIAQAGLTAGAFWLFLGTRQGEIFLSVGNYHSVLGIYLRADLLSAMFVLLTTFIFLIAVIYSFNEDYSRLFWFLMFIWQGATIGIFLTADMFNIFVLTEVATLAVVVLIMYTYSKRNMYDGMIYLFSNAVVIQFFVFGLGYVYRLTGTMDMYLMSARINEYQYSYLMLPYAAIMTSVAFKCALV